MRIDTIPLFFRLVILTAGALTLAIMISPFNFLMLEAFLLGGFIAAYLLFKDITKVIFAWLLCLMFVGFMKMALGMDVPNLSPDRVIWLFLFGYYLFNLVKGELSLSGRAAEILMLILCCLVFFSYARNPAAAGARDFLDKHSFLFNGYIAPFSIFLIAKDLVREERQMRGLFSFLSVILLYLSVTAIFEHFNLAGLVFPREIMDPSAGINFGRSRGPFLNPAVNGTVLGMLGVTNFYMAMNTRFPQKAFFILNIFLSLAAVFFTYTRASWFGVMLAFIFTLSINRRFRKYALLSALLGFMIMIPLHSKIWDASRFEKRLNSKGPIDDRINLYHTYIRMIKERPVMGFGFADFDNYSREYFSRMKGDDLYRDLPTIHNAFFGILVELGALGFIVYLSMLALIFRGSLALHRASDEAGFTGRGMVTLFWGVGIVYFFNLFFIDMKFHQFQNVIFYMIAGLLMGIYHRKAGNENICQ
ncbi:MAG: O-antigen ligase family protein [Candidatus Omnitrophota bacterium]